MEISVIIPTYKPGDYIFQCLDSLKQQTLSLESFEVIIILNGCDEPYHSRISNYLATCPKQFCASLVQTDRGGVSKARNIGIEKARGHYLCFIDDDDWVSPTYLQGLLSLVTGDDATVVSNVLSYEEDTHDFHGDWLTACYKRNAKNPQKATLLSCRNFMSVPWGKILPRKVVGDYRFDESEKQGEDSLLNFQISYRIKKFIVAGEDVVYYRRVRAKSYTRKRSHSSMISDNAILALQISKIYFKNPCRYSFLFYINRILACVKGTISNIIRF